MSFFQGQETYSIDSKGRVNIPAKMRKMLSNESNETFVVTRGTDNCVVAYPMDEWKKYQTQLQALNQYDEKNRYFLRVLLMWSDEVSLDSQNRISVPKRLIEFAGIDKKVLIMGMVDKIEFWNPETFEESINNFGESYEDVAKFVMTKKED